MKLKKITSLLLSWSSLLLVLSSVVMFIMPQGKIAYWANWSWLGLDKETWGALHTNIGFLFLAACALHAYFNWSHIVAYLKNRGSQMQRVNGNNLLSIILVGAVAAFTILGLPPVSWMQSWGDSFKDDAIVKYGEPPYGHAELSSLADFCRRTGQDLDEVISLLAAGGIDALPTQKIVDIAKSARITPQELANRMNTPSKAESCAHGDPAPKAKGSGSGGGAGSGGYGSKTLETFCAEHGVAYEDAAARLKAAGFEPAPKVTLRAIAEQKGDRPSVVVNLVIPGMHE